MKKRLPDNAGADCAEAGIADEIHPIAKLAILKKTAQCEIERALEVAFKPQFLGEFAPRKTVGNREKRR